MSKTFEEIETEVNIEFLKLRDKEKSKPKNQIILEALNSSIIEAENYLHLWEEVIALVKENSSFAQLSGQFIFEYAVLLKEKAILAINHFLESNKNSINIHFFLNVIENGRQKYIDNSKWEIAKLKIKEHRETVAKIKKDNQNVITIRDQEIAHKDKKTIENKFDKDITPITPSLLSDIINTLRRILDYYYQLFDLNERSGNVSSLEVKEFLGLKTGMKDLINVVNLAFEKLSFDDKEIQKIADSYKYFG